MPTELELAIDFSAPVPGEVEAWLRSTETFIDDFFESEANKRHPLYLPSDALPFFQALRTVRDQSLSEGKVFCELGSGFGVHAGVAALLGFEAHGIEFEAVLIDHAQELADSAGISITYHETSYIPEGFESVEGQGGTELLVPEYLGSGRMIDDGPLFEGTELSAAEIDVFYMYPRPDDQDFMLRLFDAIAYPGALLLTWFGVGDPIIFQKE